LNKILLSLFVFFMLFPMAYAHGFSTMGEDCSKCHILTKDEATTMMKALDPNLNVLDIRSSPVKAIWEITIATDGQKVLAYVDFSKRYVLFGNILDTKDKKNLTRERLSEINRVDFSAIPLDDALVMGDKSALHKVIVFSDPECPYCGKLHQEIKKIIEKRKDIVFFIKMFPLPMHKGAYDKAKAIVCSKSTALLDDAFENKTIPAAKCDTPAIDNNIKLAGTLGISGTPAIIFSDGRVVPGFLNAEPLIQEIDKK